MRKYIDEELEFQNGIAVKKYVDKIKNLSADLLIDEFINQHRKLYPDHNYDKESIYEWHRVLGNLSNLDLMAKALEEKFYVFDDMEEHIYNKQVIQNFISNRPVYNRWTNEQY